MEATNQNGRKNINNKAKQKAKPRAGTGVADKQRNQ
jgi:hypothetical protein